MNTLIYGLCLGGIYALVALGYTMVYGIAKMLNFAHGDIIMTGAYAIFVVIAAEGHVVLALVCAIVLCTVLGLLSERLAYRPLRAASPLAVLITAIGVSYLLRSIVQIIFGSARNPITVVPPATVKIFDTDVSVSSIVTLALCTVIMLALHFFVKKTKIGCAMLAVSEDRGAASLMGINTNFIISLTFAIGSALAAFAALFYLMQTPVVEPTLGALPGIKAFTAAVIGGIGSIPGAMIGGILLGVIEKFSLSIPELAPYTDAIEFGLLILILLVRPVGLLGKKRREKV